MTYASVQRAAEALHLTILGGFHPTADDKAPAGCKTLLLLGPEARGFWPAFTASDEWRDGRADPMDRWSRRVIDGLAQDIGATPLYPFGGPPHLPFFHWATRTGRIHASPVMLLVHDTAGLFVSFRGALALEHHVALPPAPPAPCGTCIARPCVTACPVDAFQEGRYDVPACKSFLDTEAGQDCMMRGCAARRACPVSQSYPRSPDQSAYHMTSFKG